ncbi:bifunctional oligoribonuclease/PAP phosphatase NrnA [candidate division KSB1 bacterium]|nr:bifunctional oligoribonuclease/PAP phosphatase NrnA [candidate division KSB1 bacterium]
MHLELDNYLKSDEIEAVKHLIENNDKFILTTHVHPDGDGLGSELGLYYALKERGKQVNIFNHNPVPRQYDFLNHDNIITDYSSIEHESIITRAQCCFVFDVSEWDRLRKLGADLRKHEIPIICIDHHPSKEKFGAININYPNASSTGEIVFLLLDALGVEFSKEISSALYTAILTDTGGFRFSNTTVNSHKMAGILIEQNIDTYKIYREVYEQEPLGKIKLLADILSNIQFECDSKVAWCSITRAMLKKYDLAPSETDGLSDFSRRIANVEVSILFLEIEESLTKISFRSNGSISINELAQSFGGGGHPYASGALVRRPLNNVIEEFKEIICNYHHINS